MSQKKSEPKSSFAAEIFEWLEMIVLSACAVLLVFTFIARPAKVDGDSMNNTLIDKELLIVSDLFYEPERGDIVVLQKIGSGHPAPIVKRVIATEGETIDYDFVTGKVTITSADNVVMVLDEGDYIKPEIAQPYRSIPMDFPITLGDGQLFVMGDNRNNSLDSRSTRIGLIDERYVLGSCLFRAYPFGQIEDGGN